MSRIGENPITIPDGVKIELKGNLINVSGQKGSQSWTVHPNIKILVKVYKLKMISIWKRLQNRKK